MRFGENIIIRRVSDAAAGTFTGLASTFSRDRHGDTILPGAFAESISALKSGARVVPLLNNHDSTTQIGAVTDATETAEGLLIHGKLVLGTPAADRAHRLMLADAMGLSVGFIPSTKSEQDSAGGYLYRNIDLVEVSAVATPSNRESRVLTVKALCEQSPADLERLIRYGELPEMPRRLAAKLAKAFRSVIQDDEDDSDSAAEAALMRALGAAKQSFTRK